MKNVILTLFLLGTIVSLGHAQEAGKGNLFVGGGFSLSHSNSNSPADNYKQSGTAFAFTPEIGYMVSHHLALGVGVSYTTNSTTTTNSSGGKTKTNAYGLGGFIFSEYYIELAEKLEFFGFAEAGYGITNNKQSHVKGPDASTFNIEAGPGIAYSFSPHFELLMKWGLLGYEFERSKSGSSGNTDVEKRNTFNFKADLSSLKLALHYYS